MKERVKRSFLLIALFVVIGLILFLFSNWINDNSDALMVIITAIYVVATFEICRANIKSAKASNEQVIAANEQTAAAKEQLEEIKRQFKEEKRLDHMPVFTVDTAKGIINKKIKMPFESNIKATFSEIKIKNIGFGAAQNIHYKVIYSDGHEKEFELRYLKVDDILSIYISTFMSDEQPKDYGQDNAEILFSFTDLLCNKYSQKINLFFKYEGDNCILDSCYVHGVEYIESKEESHA